MKHWSSRQVIALFLGVIMTLGMGLSAAQAGEMAVQMAMASDADTSGQGNCDGCSDDDSANAVTCSPALNCAGMTALLPAAGGFAVPQAIKQVTPVAGMVHDLTAPPDPYPPKSPNLG